VVRKKLNIGIIGIGKMGEAFISGFLQSKKITTNNIKAFDIDKNRSKYISATYKVECLNNINSIINLCDIIILVVKPRDIKNVLKEVGKVILPNKIVISSVAGINIDYIKKFLPKSTPIIRIMPNLACSICESMIGVTSSKTSKTQNDSVINILSLLGLTIYIEEKHMDAFTSLVGSGLAYIYLVIESLSDAGVKLGITREISTLISSQTTLGAAKMILETKEHPAKLRDRVVTPAGTTIEGLLEMERRGLRSSIISGVIKASERSKQLQTS
jgi:pyrroline-5-carboxylate reductase